MFTMSPGAALVGLVIRRLKWHQCEFNRIYACKDRLPSETALQALSQHYTAIRELNALRAMAEPEWGDERQITEAFYNWKTDANDTPEEAFQKLLSQKSEQPPHQERQETGDPDGHSAEGTEEDSKDIGGDDNFREWYGCPP